MKRKYTKVLDTRFIETKKVKCDFCGRKEYYKKLNPIRDVINRAMICNKCYYKL